MKLRYAFTVMDMDGEYAAVPVGEAAELFHGMLKLNEVSALIMEQLAENTTPQEIHNKLKEKYPDSSDQEIGENLAHFLNQLIMMGMLENITDGVPQGDEPDQL